MGGVRGLVHVQFQPKAVQQRRGLGVDQKRKEVGDSACKLGSNTQKTKIAKKTTGGRKIYNIQMGVKKGGKKELAQQLWI